jgi:molybdenum cofactor biosynthesis enzyme MoaA
MKLDWLFNRDNICFDWIQVEISSYCNASCVYCPYTVYKKNWQNRHLPLELFKKLIPALRSTKLAYLQGWGEPFTRPHSFQVPPSVF